MNPSNARGQNMTTREFFRSATFTALLLFLCSLAALTIGIIYGKVNISFYLVSAGLFMSPVSLLFHKRKIILPTILDGIKYEYQLSRVIQWVTVMAILPVIIYSAKTIMQVSAYTLFLVLSAVILFSLKYNGRKMDKDIECDVFLKK